MAGSTDFKKAVVFIKGNGPHNGTLLLDNSHYGHELNRDDIGSAYYSTTESKFGGSSIYVPTYIKIDSIVDRFVDPIYRLPQVPILGNFSISFWVRPDAAGGGIDQGLFGFQNLNGYFRLNENTSGRLSLTYYRNGTTATLTAGSLGLTAGVWQHIVVSWNGVTLRIFKDGVVAASVALSSATNLVGLCDQGILGYIGYDGVSSSCPGYYQDFVFVNGNNAFFAAFTPPTDPTTDYYRVIQGTITETSAITLWEARAYEYVTGIPVGFGVFDTSVSTSYTLNVATEQLCYVVLRPRVHKTLNLGSDLVGDKWVVAPPDASSNFHLWKVEKSIPNTGTVIAIPTMVAPNNYFNLGTNGYQLTYLGPITQPIVQGPLLPIDI